MEILKRYYTSQYEITVTRVEHHKEEIIDTKHMTTNVSKKHDNPKAIYEHKNIDSGFSGMNFGVTISRG